MSELATYDTPKPALLRPIARPEEVINAHKELTAFVNEALEDGKDFGLVPGTERKTLMKAGAERLTAGFGLRPEFEVIEQDVDHNYECHYAMTKWVTVADPGRAEKDRLKAEGLGRNRKNGNNWIWQVPERESGTSLGLYRFVMRCRLLLPDGREVGQGVGSCSSLEAKYIRAPRDAENTVLKMAKKRAFVDAVLTTLGLSDRFTQDAEDNVENKKARGDEEAIDGEVVEESSGQRTVSATGPKDAAPEYVRPTNWLTLDRNANKPETDEATAFMKEIGMAPHFDEFKRICDKLDVRFAALACKDRGITDPKLCIAFIRDGEVPGQESGAVIEAEVVADPKATDAPSGSLERIVSEMFAEPPKKDDDDPFEFEPQTHHQYNHSCTTETGDRIAFGWKPYRWPKPTAMNAQPATEMADLGQRCRALADVRNIAPDRFDSVRAALCEALTIGSRADKFGGWLVFWDFLESANDQQVAEAKAAAK